MGNALVPGDALTVAEMSVMESYYSAGLTSDTTDDENTDSVGSRPPQSEGVGRSSDDRDSGGGRLRGNNTGTASGRTISSSDNRASTTPSNTEEQQLLHHPHPATTGTRGPPPRRYTSDLETETRTESSSAYHHGYRMRNEGLDKRDDIEFRSDVGRYGFEHALNYNRFPKNKNKGMTNNLYTNHPVKSNPSNHHNRSKDSSHPHLHHSVHPLSSTTSNHGNRQQYRSMFSNTSSRGQDSVVAEASRGGMTMSTLGEIPPAETDMAYAGSGDEEEAQAIRDKESKEIVMRSTARTTAADPPSHHGQQSERCLTPSLAQAASESLQHQQRAQQLLRESTDLKQQLLQDEQVMLRQQKAAAQLLLMGEKMRQSQDDAWKQQQAAAQRHLNKERQASGDESLLRQQQAHQLLHGDGTELSDSFSTLTKTLSTTLPPLPPDDDEPVEKKENARSPKGPASPLAYPGSAGAPPEQMEESDEDSPAQQQLQELLKQQQMQEEKLQKQLEQLRVQKERLQQLQEEKKRSASVATKPSAEGNNSVHQGSRHARNEELRIQKERMRAVKADPSRDGSGGYLRNTVEAARQEQTRRQRLERARQKVMPKKKKPDAEGSQNANTEQMSHTEEESYTGTGTATGEMDVSFPEYEDVPSHFKLDQNAPAPYQENDLTTLSASLTEYAHDDSSTVSSMKDCQGPEDELNALEVMSSIDEEIDLVFVAKYDKAFNAFLDTYPALFDKDSELIQNLKVAKLQRILEESYQTERELEARLEAPGDVKTNLEAEFQKKLKEASRQKAERTIQLQAELNQVKKQSRAQEAKLTWDMFLLAVNRARKFYKINSELKNKNLTSRHDLLASLPDTNLMREVIKAVEAKPRDTFDDKQKKELQQCQVDNAILSSEVKVLQQKLAALTKERGRQEELDRALVQMDSKKLKKVKGRFQKRLGAAF